ncbi:MAG: hypothetical protein ACOC97_04870 [Myxococcota bacterium]
MHDLTSVLGAALLVLVAGCSNVRSSTVHTGANRHAPHQGAVTVQATQVPPQAEELAVVQTRGHNVELSDLVPDFAREVAKVGGNFGKVDKIRTKFEVTQQNRQETYQCGTQDAPQTCTRTVTDQVEIATTTITGRAFRVSQ